MMPPGLPPEGAPLAIVVSPLVGRQPKLPPPELLIQMALEAEAKVAFEITQQLGPTAIATATGLAGVSFDVTGYVRPAGAVERRIYVMLADQVCCYGLTYLAQGDALFAHHLAAFWAVVQSVRPFEGKVGAPPSL